MRRNEMLLILARTQARSRQLRQLTGMTVVLCLLTGIFMPTADAQTGLRRLFTTPNLRAELDRRRLRELQGEVETVAPAFAEPVSLEELESERPVPDTIYRLGGSMRRGDGSYTIWINDIPYDQSELPANIQLVLPYNQGQLRISHPDTNATFLVKPGQVLNLTQGELLESYQYRAPSAAITAVNNSNDAQPEPTTADPDTEAADAAQESIEQAQGIRDPQQ